MHERDYYVILVDYTANPPAKVFADEHIQESTLDQDKVYEIAKEHNATLVISACVDQANISACYAMEKLGLYCPFSFDTICKITNKGNMKQTMLDNQIPTSRFVYCEKGVIPDSNFGLNFPVIVKPADGNSSNGVKVAYDKKDMIEYLHEAQKISRTGKTIVEEFVSGTEVSAYCIVSDKTAHIVMCVQRSVVFKGEEKIPICFAASAPANISEAAMSKLESAASDIARAYCLDNTPLLVQAIITDDEVSVFEFAPRVGGGASYKAILLSTGYDIISATIDSYLGKQISTQYQEVRDKCTTIIMHTTSCVFDHFENEDDLIYEGLIEGLYLYKSKGAIMDDSVASKGKIGSFITKAKTQDELKKKLSKVFDRLEAHDTEGKSVLKREYLQLFLDALSE